MLASSEFEVRSPSSSHIYQEPQGLDVHKKTISYCVKDAAGHVHREGKIGSTWRELDAWVGTLPQPRTIAMEATIFTGWIALLGRTDLGLDQAPGQLIGE
jgi:hypothetical protein